MTENRSSVSSQSYLAACVQAAPVAFDPSKTVEKVRDLAAKAASAGARLILFPEAFISAYPRGSSFGTSIGSRSKEGREQFERYFASSIDVPGRTTDALGLIAKENRAFLVIGVIERSGGTLYCTVLFFGSDGSLMGFWRWIDPTGLRHSNWAHRLSHLLGELYADAAGRHVCAANSNLLRSDSRWADNLAADHAARRSGRTMLCAVEQSILPSSRLSTRLCFGPPERA